jgi:hypothetical protein
MTYPSDEERRDHEVDHVGTRSRLAVSFIVRPARF